MACSLSSQVVPSQCKITQVCDCTVCIPSGNSGWCGALYYLTMLDLIVEPNTGLLPTATMLLLCLI